MTPKEFYFTLINSASFYFVLVVIAFLLVYLAFLRKPSAPARRGR